MAKFVSIFNNKGGVGKTVITWNLGDTLARKGKRVLLIDFDPQCNLSIAVLGEARFRESLPMENVPYGMCIRSYLQRFLQNTGGEEVFLHQGGDHSHPNLHLIAGDFWLNVYAESLNVGSDLLTGQGISKFVVLNRMVEAAEHKLNLSFDYVLVDLPPSFGSLVRASLYSSDYLVVPCTSDNFSAYCVGLIGQMLPNFISDWNAGLQRFRESNPQFREFDRFGKPVFAGWIFNGFDTAKKRYSGSDEKEMVQADKTHHLRISEAINDDLVSPLRRRSGLLAYDAVIASPTPSYQLGGIEDMNVLVQNSLWQNVPISQLDKVKQLNSLQARTSWAYNQLDQIERLRIKLEELADNFIAVCA